MPIDEFIEYTRLLEEKIMIMLEKKILPFQFLRGLQCKVFWEGDSENKEGCVCNGSHLKLKLQLNAIQGFIGNELTEERILKTNIKFAKRGIVLTNS